jgi:hypothetical protein
MRTPRSRRHGGWAALELLLVIPLLMTLMALTILVARAGLASIQAAVSARRIAWSAASSSRSEEPFDLGRLWTDTELVAISADEPLRGLPVLPGLPRKARARYIVTTGGSWDDRDFNLSDSSPYFHPDFDLLQLLLRHSLSGF